MFHEHSLFLKMFMMLYGQILIDFRLKTENSQNKNIRNTGNIRMERGLLYFYSGSICFSIELFLRVLHDVVQSK